VSVTRSEIKKIHPALILASWIGVCLAAVAVNRPLFVLINGIKLPGLDWVMLSATHLGNGAVAGMLVLLLTPFRRDLTLRTAAAMIVAGVLVHMIKDFVPMPRPPALIGESVNVLGPRLMGKSFPSGHTATVFALAFALKGCVDRRVFKAVLAAAVLVGVSRVYTGVHFPVDAAFGGFFGWLSAAVTRGPVGYFVRHWQGPNPCLDRFFLFLAALSGVYLAFFEPMMRYNPWFLRPLGLAGLGAAVFLLVRVPVKERGAI